MRTLGRRGPSQAKIKDFCQLSQRESQYDKQKFERDGIMGREFELKYVATAAQQQAIRDAFSDFQIFQMETTYFDTPEGSLSQRHVTLRLRKENGTSICTMKTPLPDGSRGEWECQADDIYKGAERLRTLGAPHDLCDLAAGGVTAICGARFTRLATRIPTADGMAELAIDSGILLGGGKEIPLCEVEIEHKSGSDQSTLELAAILATRFGLVREKRSKFRRALDLAKGD